LLLRAVATKILINSDSESIKVSSVFIASYSEDTSTFTTVSSDDSKPDPDPSLSQGFDIVSPLGELRLHLGDLDTASPITSSVPTLSTGIFNTAATATLKEYCKVEEFDRVT